MKAAWDSLPALPIRAGRHRFLKKGNYLHEMQIYMKWQRKDDKKPIRMH
jgi:hypothetical protein